MIIIVRLNKVKMSSHKVTSDEHLDELLHDLITLYKGCNFQICLFPEDSEVVRKMPKE